VYYHSGNEVPFVRTQEGNIAFHRGDQLLINAKSHNEAASSVQQ
jgi:hypothetical protein